MAFIESFKSTLSEVVESDVLLHVIDASSPNFEEQMSVVKDTLDEIGVKHRNIIEVFNKVDSLKNKEIISGLKQKHNGAVFISAKKGLNISSLLKKIKDTITSEDAETVIKLKPHDYKGLNEIYRKSEVKEVKYLKTGIRVKIKSNNSNLEYLGNKK